MAITSQDILRQYKLGKKPEKKNFIQNIISGIVDPYVWTAQLAGEGIQRLGQETNQPMMQQNASFYSPEEQAQIQADPMRFGIQRLADVGSIGLNALAPGAGSLTKAIGLGALGGGLGAIGGAEQEEDLLNAGLGGAVTGGVLG